MARMISKKKSDQMRQETIDALEVFIKNLKEYIRKGNYEIKYVHRNYRTEEVESIDLELNGNDITISKNDVGVIFRVKTDINDVLNQRLLDAYDRLTIDRDISYYEEMLKKLKAQKKNLANTAFQKIDDEDIGS